MITLLDRINVYASSKGMTKAAIEREAGLPNGTFKSKTYTLRPDTQRKLEVAFPDLNISWLLTGNGEMLNGAETAGCTAEVRPQLDRKPVDDNIVIDYIATLKAQLATLNQVVQEKEETIKELLQQLDYYRSALERLRVAIAQDDQVTLKKEISSKTA